MFWELVWAFFKIGLVSFGGGYAMIPVIEREVSMHGWLTIQEFTKVVAIAGMSPGPIATNCAIIVGFQLKGLTGAFLAGLGMVLPSLLCILMLSTFFYRYQSNRMVKSAFYGLRPMITGLIVYAAIRFSIGNGLFESLSWHTFSLMFIYLLSLMALFFARIHPVGVIGLSGLVGIVLYT